jgi:hypothetical protein
MTPGEVGVLLTLVTIPEESRLCNITLLATAGITPKPHIQPTNFTTSPPMIPITAPCETIISVLKTHVAVGRKFVRQKTHDIHPQEESGPSATLRLLTPLSAPGPTIAKEPPSTYNVMTDRIGGMKGRTGIGMMAAARVGGRMTHGSPDKVVTLAAKIPIGSVGIFKMTVLNATQKTGHGSLLRHGNHHRGAVGAGKASALRTTDATRIGIGVAGGAKKVVTVTSNDGISDLMIVT